jgi:tetratricopeptide (TPR) repeat protein
LADPEREVAEGIRLARRAVGIGMDDPVALLFGGGGLGHLAGEAENGIVYIDRAIILNPNLALAWAESGNLRMYRGEHADAIMRIERAMRLSPLDLHASRIYASMGWTHLFAGRYDEAAAWARKAALEKPGWAVPPRIEATACALSGRIAEAQEALARMRVIDPDLRLSHLGKQRGVASRLRRSEDLVLFIEGLRLAGLPE